MSLALCAGRARLLRFRRARRTVLGPEPTGLVRTGPLPEGRELRVGLGFAVYDPHVPSAEAAKEALNAAQCSVEAHAQVGAVLQQADEGIAHGHAAQVCYATAGVHKGLDRNQIQHDARQGDVFDPHRPNKEHDDVVRRQGCRRHQNRTDSGGSTQQNGGLLIRQDVQEQESQRSPGQPPIEVHRQDSGIAQQILQDAAKPVQEHHVPEDVPEIPMQEHVADRRPGLEQEFTSGHRHGQPGQVQTAAPDGQKSGPVSAPQ